MASTFIGLNVALHKTGSRLYYEAAHPGMRR